MTERVEETSFQVFEGKKKLPFHAFHKISYNRVITITLIYSKLQVIQKSGVTFPFPPTNDVPKEESLDVVENISGILEKSYSLYIG